MVSRRAAMETVLAAALALPLWTAAASESAAREIV